MNAREELVSLCRTLGEPHRELAVLGEGNASMRSDGDHFLVTTSGSRLADLTSRELAEVPLAPAAELARSASADADGGFDRATLTALARPDADGVHPVPSIETLLHALVLDRTGATHVGHTHPTSVLGLVCSVRADEAFASPIFPDEVVVCGPTYLVVPYAAPGPALAAALAAALDQHLEREPDWPRAIILANHGLLALGASATEVLAVTTMVDKSARARATALAVGGLRPLPPDAVRALVGRDDERFRRQLLMEGDG